VCVIYSIEGVGLIGVRRTTHDGGGSPVVCGLSQSLRGVGCVGYDGDVLGLDLVEC
jgi:hypothetical protein